MATVQQNSIKKRASRSGMDDNTASSCKPRMHRVATVREQQGVSLRSASERLGVSIRELRRQEDESVDLLLSDLHRWQQVLDVPLADLLVEPDAPLSVPVLERARLVKLMKTVMAIKEQSSAASVRRLAQNMTEQLVEIMPELEEVRPWRSASQRRGPDECGRAVEHCIAEDFLYRPTFD